MEPKLKYYGNTNLPFVYLLGLDQMVEKIENGVYEPVRTDCYTNDTSYEVTPRIIKMLGYDKYTKSEVFYPMKEYPPHVDKDARTITVPLMESCELVIGEEKMQIHKGGVYEFDSTQPHSSKGAFLMISGYE